ncbi:hypothetical protein E2C01_018363 [Portunus trituberculatus]|uniref:Uncharacterized protein n=1 Tax=Portunus trituberculatus TaxID=210409 RepID=A0A5B7DUY6_PORTR|nr:hypothetical protein [Portunus trituberculatus]
MPRFVIPLGNGPHLAACPEVRVFIPRPITSGEVMRPCGGGDDVRCSSRAWLGRPGRGQPLCSRNEGTILYKQGHAGCATVGIPSIALITPLFPCFLEPLHTLHIPGPRQHSGAFHTHTFTSGGGVVLFRARLSRLRQPTVVEVAAAASGDSTVPTRRCRHPCSAFNSGSAHARRSCMKLLVKSDRGGNLPNNTPRGERLGWEGVLNEARDHLVHCGAHVVQQHPRCGSAGGEGGKGEKSTVVVVVVAAVVMVVVSLSRLYI